MIRERPQCRRVIQEQGLKPYLVDGEWDGLYCHNPDGTHSEMSDGFRKQMKKMVAEGHWASTESQLSQKDNDSYCEGDSK